jgi:hypothetical protein
MRKKERCTRQAIVIRTQNRLPVLLLERDGRTEALEYKKGCCIKILIFYLTILS